MWHALASSPRETWKLRTSWWPAKVQSGQAMRQTRRHNAKQCSWPNKNAIMPVQQQQQQQNNNYNSNKKIITYQPDNKLPQMMKRRPSATAQKLAASPMIAYGLSHHCEFAPKNFMQQMCGKYFDSLMRNSANFYSTFVSYLHWIRRGNRIYTRACVCLRRSIELQKGWIGRIASITAQ